MTYRALKAGFKVKEVPIVFRDRQAGTSKMTARIALEAVWKVPALKLRLR
jgi:dolichol-phosphate mannosyltransferase